MRELTATYRLQMNAGFTFSAALRRVEYFRRLGVSHLYLSPITAARKGSMHGYDVVDPCRLNPELGTEADLRALAAELHARDMGLIVDIVPNHMGIGPENARWEDVLTHGSRSRYANWFDIDWTPQGGAAKVVLPVLGRELGAVLAKGELSVTVRDGETPRLRYYQQSFPLDPASLPPELQLTTFDAEETGELANLFSGRAGAERLRVLLEDQHYRLVYWRRGPAEINYRRFFDVNDLAAVRVEDEAVFTESHALILALVEDGIVDGLRVDHIDGLLDPRKYLDRLRAALPAGTPVFVEKILSSDEQLRPEWPVDGTTGYEFLNDVEDLFIDPTGFARIESAYRRARRLPASTTFRDIARNAKLAILRGALRADVARLSRHLLPLARSSGKRWTVADIDAAIAELIASLPVYRTYIDGRALIADTDRLVIENARTDALARSEGALAEHIDFVANVLLDEVDSADPSGRLDFVARFQQVSGPATAKGVEDTALYVYIPLVSRNEVGGAPDRPLESAVERFHAGNRVRAEHWPRCLTATNTHDTKRSADVRARLDALSDVAPEWERSIRRWRRLNARHRTIVSGRLAPDTNTEYLIYQTLVALWPPPRPGRRVDDLPDRAWRDAVGVRLVRYALKAAREAKTQTSWVDPNGAYENALNGFVGAILEPRDDAPFLADIARLVARIAPIGAWNTLSRVVLHLTSPGTPDIYQGDEQWNFTLVDPDNRGQIDYDARERDLSEMAAAPTVDPGTRSKMYIVERLLDLRRERAAVFQNGSYEVLQTVGRHAHHVIAFVRAFEGQRILTVATRPAPALAQSEAATRWADTRIVLPPEMQAIRWRSRLAADSFVYEGRLELGTLLHTIPVAVLAD